MMDWDCPRHIFFFKRIIDSWWLFQLHPWKLTAGSPKNLLELKRTKIIWPKPLWLWVPNINCPGCKSSNADPNANSPPPPSGNEAYFIRIIENSPGCLVVWDRFKDSNQTLFDLKKPIRSSDTLSLGVLRFVHKGGKEETNIPTGFLGFEHPNGHVP